MLRPAGALLVALCLTGVYPYAQSPPALGEVLDKMATYLRDYESRLTQIVATERFDQQVIVQLRSGPTTTKRRIDSDVAFVRLPGDAEWLGSREVLKVDGRAVPPAQTRMSDLFKAGTDMMTQARAIAAAGARYNQGLPRTINVPTAPLDIIHPRHGDALRYRLEGADTVNKVRTAIVGFVEVGRPTLVREPDGANLVSSGRVWLEPESGRILRIHWTYRAEQRRANAERAPSLRVDFAADAALDMLVPREMREEFSVTRGRGEGRAVYSNFRTFQTSARIVPPQP